LLLNSFDIIWIKGWIRRGAHPLFISWVFQLGE
jgi:hypothetical protein